MSADGRQRQVMYVIDELGGGGAERQLSLLARHLPAAWRPIVFSLSDGPFAAELSEARIRVEIRPRRFAFDVGPGASLLRLVDEVRPDLVHSFGWMSALAAEAVCRLRRLPHVGGTIRRGTVSPRRRWLTVKASRLGDRVIGNSEAGLRSHGVTAAKGRVVYNGFDPARLRSAPARAPGAEDSGLVVMAATVDERKDFGAFLAAARRLAAEPAVPPWRCVVLGEGPDLAALRAVHADLERAGAVAFTGRVPEVMAHYPHAMAGVIMSTHGEGLSNSIMEYMVCGLPAVCSEGGGNRELVVDGVTGFVVPSADAGALAERLRWLRGHPAEAVEMGSAGRARILEHFTLERMLASTLAVYAEVLPQARDAAAGAGSGERR
jgi:glycosyltransferase involved in cell wall biosynthesis